MAKLKNRINSRKKGSRMERKALEGWQKWTKYEFSRVPASGGLRWHKTDNITGDIICTDDRHKCLFSIEVKARNKIDFSKLINTQHKCEIIHFWTQALADGKRGNKIPILMMRYDGLSPNTFFFMALKTKHFLKFYPEMAQDKDLPYMKLYGKYNITIFHSDMFFKSKYEKIAKIAKAIYKKEWPELYKRLMSGL